MAMAVVPVEQITFDLAGTWTRRREEVLYPVVCSSCGRHIVDTTIATAEAWCQSGAAGG
jgi:hypothetical protein